MRPSLPRFFWLRLISVTTVLLLVIGIDAQAQSSDARFPTPVSSNEIVDSIPARDLGDSRLTDYFYTFTGLPGDLLITLESKNLNGDVDIFTAGELRPLMKITFYAESTTSASKNIYLRKRESLILRIEARTPNDDPGSYRIRFSGSFEPIGAGPLVAESEKPETNKDTGRAGERKTSRVSSVGARIEEPAEEVAAAPTPKPTPQPTPKATPSPSPEKVREPAKTAARTSRPRRTLPRKPPPKTPAPTETAKDTEKEPAKDAGDSKPPEASTSKASETESPSAATDTARNAGAESEKKKPETAAKKPPPYRRPTVRKAPARPPAPKPEPQPEDKGRLVIDEKDGTRQEFLMSNVRKVTVENGEIVVVVIDGRVYRIPMTLVARMSIGP